MGKSRSPYVTHDDDSGLNFVGVDLREVGGG
jgi:hypothetical protein